jgi:hypothetical protein
MGWIEEIESEIKFSRPPCNMKFHSLEDANADGQASTVRYQASSQNCEKRLLASSCLSVRMEQLVSHLTDYHEI